MCIYIYIYIRIYIHTYIYIYIYTCKYNVVKFIKLPDTLHTPTGSRV